MMVMMRIMDHEGDDHDDDDDHDAPCHDKYRRSILCVPSAA